MYDSDVLLSLLPPSPVGNAFVGNPNDPNNKTLNSTATRPSVEGI